MFEERFDRIDAGLNRLTILHEETQVQVKLIAEGLVTNTERLDSVDQRLGRIETLLTRHDTRITALERRPRVRR